VVAQMSARDGFGGGADVGGGRTLSRCRGGRGIDSVQLQMWVGGGGGLGPGADVGGYEPSPVVSDERSPQCRCGLIEVSCTNAALSCVHTQQVHETCSPSGRKTTVHRTTIVPRVWNDSVAVCGLCGRQWR
jgi:hypothetical protein